mgnify:CR=1 FL=1
MIEQVTEKTLPLAAYVHALSWQASHTALCSPEFIAQHTPERQAEYLRGEMGRGKRLFLLTDGKPVGVVTVWGSLIENLYVLPEKQKMGYGTMLLDFAIRQCENTPTLWVLNTNETARKLYLKNGFLETGTTRALNERIYEIEMVLKG